MCGNTKQTIMFISPDAAGNFSVAHNFLVMGAVRIAADGFYFEPIKAATLFIDAAKKNWLHQAWLGRIYNMNCSSVKTSSLEINDVFQVGVQSSPAGSSTIFPIEAAQYVPHNNWISEGQYNTSEFFGNTVNYVAVLKCNQKPTDREI